MSFGVAKLLEMLREKQLMCQCQPVDYLGELTLEHKLVHCLIVTPGHDRPFAGFWLHCGSGLALVGVWSGQLYRLLDTDRIVDFAVDFRKAIDKTPYDVPSELKDRYYLAPTSVLTAWPSTTIERLDEVGRQTRSLQISQDVLTQRIASQVDEVLLDENGFVTVRKGDASVLTRLPIEAAQPIRWLTLLVDGRWPGSIAQNEILQTIEKTLGCLCFDVNWHNRVHWDDPYYSLANGDDRPPRPRNAA